MTALFDALKTWHQAIREARDPAFPPVHGWHLPYIGCGLEFEAKGAALLREAHERYGDTFTLYIAGKLITVCRDEAFKRRVYSAGVEEISFYEALKTIAGFGELVVMGETGPEGANVGLDTLRGFLAPRVREAPADIDAELRWRIETMGERGEFDVFELFNKWTLELTATVLTGPQLSRDDAFLRDLVAFDRAVLQVTRAPMPGRAVREGVEVRDRLLDRLVAEIERRRGEGEGAARSPDLIDAMLVATDPEGRRFSDQSLALELIGYMFATSANTPAAASQCMLHILADPELRARVIREQRELVEAHGEALGTEAFRGMHVLTACFHEVLRMYTPGLHLRLCLGPCAAGRHELPAGRLIAFSPYTMHRDPSIYTDPDVFDVDRFLDGPRAPAGKPQIANFIAFGRGPHACLGKNLARIEVLACIARMLRDWELEPVAPIDPQQIHWATNGVAAADGPRRVRYARVS